MHLIEAVTDYKAAVESGRPCHPADARAKVRAFAAVFPHVEVFGTASESVEAVINTARRYWATQQDFFGRYWVATLADSDHGAYGLGAAASDGTGKSDRMLTAPGAPGFAIIGVDDLIKGARPRMSVAPFQSNEFAPQLDWNMVGLLMIRPTDMTPTLAPEILKLKALHGFVLGIDATQEPEVDVEAIKHANLVAWGLGLNVQHGACAVLADSVMPPLPASVSDLFTFHVAGFVAEGLAKKSA